MGDDEAGTAAHHLVHRLLNQRLGQRVHRTRRLVHNEQIGLRQHRPRQTEQLLLPDGEQHTPFTNLGVITLL